VSSNSPGLRRDAARNRERLLDAALRLFHERGEKVPSLAIAKAAGVGAGTLYRHFPTREDLAAALAHRSYRIALGHASEAADGAAPAPDALRTFFARTIERRDELMLPLHGGPVTLDDEAVQLRTAISAALDRVLARGRREGTIRPDVTSTDVILMGALLAQPLSSAPRPRSTSRACDRPTARDFPGRASLAPSSRSPFGGPP
jgi:AcrR family transcriptional regulator